MIKIVHSLDSYLQITDEKVKGLFKQNRDMLTDIEMYSEVSEEKKMKRLLEEFKDKN